ncbi:MAG: peptidyl-prolyl cis-trans isomerase [Betaproteobacteria bacterium]|nr:peptidyl-prolyl cis-trans isomerase [Betaproteobacteria bacterium]
MLGACVFGIDRIVAEKADDPRTITVSAAVDAEVRAVFAEARKRDPNASELDALRRVWLDNEVLYREGLAMQLDKGDATIRDRVIFKALSAIEANLKLPAIDDNGLRTWFERHRPRYDEPVRFDFQEAVLPTDTAESALQAFAAALNSGTPGDARAALDAFRARPRPTVVQSYGEEFARALESSTPGEWRVLKAKDRSRIIRLESTIPARPAEFDAIRNAVTQDWVDATMAELRSAAVKNLATKYTIKGFEAHRP